MGWDVVDSGFKVVLGADVPDIVERELPGEVAELLAQFGLKRSDLDFVVAHPGGPRVLKAMEQALELGADALTDSWASLQRHGNMSSSSVLFVLKEALKKVRRREENGLMAAMGPGFCAELSLLQSQECHRDSR